MNLPSRTELCYWSNRLFQLSQSFTFRPRSLVLICFVARLAVRELCPHFSSIFRLRMWWWAFGDTFTTSAISRKTPIFFRVICRGFNTLATSAFCRESRTCTYKELFPDITSVPPKTHHLLIYEWTTRPLILILYWLNEISLRLNLLIMF